MSRRARGTVVEAVSEHQLQLDLDECRRLLEGLKDRRRVDSGPARLLAELVRAGLAERDLIPAAALCLEIDRSNHNHQEEQSR